MSKPAPRMSFIQALIAAVAAAACSAAVAQGAAAVVSTTESLNAVQAEPGESVMVVGLGGVGTAALITAVAQGVARVIAVQPAGHQACTMRADDVGFHVIAHVQNLCWSSAELLARMAEDRCVRFTAAKFARSDLVGEILVDADGRQIRVAVRQRANWIARRDARKCIRCVVVRGLTSTRGRSAGRVAYSWIQTSPPSWCFSP